jgi:hypothetical protein
MKIFSSILLILFLSTLKQLNANTLSAISSNDSLTLGEAFVNLSLTGKYFDTLKIDRITKIIRFEEKEWASITDTVFIKNNNSLYNLAYSLLYYAKAKELFLTKKDTTRKGLLEWKNTLDIAKEYSEKSGLGTFEKHQYENTYYEFIGLDIQMFNSLQDKFYDLRNQFAPYFNRDIYPDFQRCFLELEKANEIQFDSLFKVANIYNMDVSMNILDNIGNIPIDTIKNNFYKFSYNKLTYYLDPALKLLPRYFEFKYIVKNYKQLCNKEFLLTQFEYFKEDLNFKDEKKFKLYETNFEKDDFFRKNLDSLTCEKLFDQLKKITTFSNCTKGRGEYKTAGGDLDDYTSEKYYFPAKAPFPSAIKYINNFKPNLQIMKQIDNGIKAIFNNAGYENQLHYYYLESGPGYAMTTSLEGIDKDGKPVNNEKRWKVNEVGYKKFSLYETYKAIFFDVESNFRIFAFVISPSRAEFQRRQSSIGSISERLSNGYSSLPVDLENVVLPQKTLTIFVYNFFQSDIGQVPKLDTNHKLSVETHLKNSGLAGLLSN